MNAWYLDDGTLAGPSEGLAAALSIMEQEAPFLGLHLNRGKSLLYIPRRCVATKSPLPGDIPIARDGFCLLGCPIGPPSYCEDVLMTHVNKIREFLARLQDLGDFHIATTLLWSCAGIT